MCFATTTSAQLACSPMRGTEDNKPGRSRPICRRMVGMKVKNTFLAFMDDGDEVQSCRIRSKSVGDEPSRCKPRSRSSSLSTSSSEHRLSDEKPDHDETTYGFSSTPSTCTSLAGDTELPRLSFTTVMIRHFPIWRQVKHLAAVLDSHGFEGTYDFLHVPFRFSKKRNFGFAFINFRDPATTCAFFHQWDGRNVFGAGDDSRFPVSVSMAQFQGKKANIERLFESKAHKVVNRALHPIVFDDNGHRVPFSAVIDSTKARIAAKK
eukprot:GEMP01039302.1.p1 GENE.GEMP01039302.1~~GEMP01039302.1.p1  ORF type:complete len:264 (+),score=48.84 GEMP01039302.1:51-842(+)